LLNGDNKGYASYLMEKHFNGNDTLPGKGDFVAAFASSNLGDVSPNTNGAICIDTGAPFFCRELYARTTTVIVRSLNFDRLQIEGLPCNFNTSTCNGKAMNCIAFGPGKDMFESTEIIGRKQFEHGLLLFQDAPKLDRLSGEVSFRHSFVDMSNRNVTLANGNVVKTCPAALGYSFAGGTTDGPGE
jgi:neutral ceramidase